MLLWPHPLQSVDGSPWKATIGRVRVWPLLWIWIVASLAIGSLASIRGGPASSRSGQAPVNRSCRVRPSASRIGPGVPGDVALREIDGGALIFASVGSAHSED